MTTTSTAPVASAAFRVGQKGRVVLPAAVRRAAGIDEGAEVVARTEGDGRLVIETVESIKRRVWGFSPQPSGTDPGEDVRRMRQQDIEESDSAAARRSEPVCTEQESRAAGAELLMHLGL